MRGYLGQTRNHPIVAAAVRLYRWLEPRLLRGYRWLEPRLLRGYRWLERHDYHLAMAIVLIGLGYLACR